LAKPPSGFADALDDFDAPAESFVASPSKDATEAKPASILSNSSSSSSSADSKTVFPGLPEPGTEDEAKMMKEFTEMMSQLAGSGGAAGGGGDESMKGFTNFLQQMTKGEDFQRILQAEQAAAKQNEAPVPHPPLMAASKPSPASETIPGEKIGQGEAKKTPPAEGGSKGEAVNEAVKMISEGFKNASEDVGGGDNPFAALGLGGDGEGGEGMDKMLAQLMKSMGEEGSAGEGGEGLDKMVEDMMKSMMSKENFFEPISEICSKYAFQHSRLICLICLRRACTSGSFAFFFLKVPCLDREEQARHGGLETARVGNPPFSAPHKPPFFVFLTLSLRPLLLDNH